jgi:hypothetical protein
MPKYRKKPVVIEAFQLTKENAFEIIQWAHEGYPPEANVIISPAERDGLLIRTKDGNMYATLGDFVIKGIKGEFYPCKPDIFEATYERANGIFPQV